MQSTRNKSGSSTGPIGPPTSSHKIAFLGLGAMGSRMAAHLVEAGYDVTVWNRDDRKAEPLLALGAKIAGSPRAAAGHADVVFSMVRDDEASQKIWLDPETGALAGMRPATLAIECSTLTTAHVRLLAKAATAQRVRFIDAPLAGSRPQADTAQLIFFVGGDEVDVVEARAVLQSMASAVHHVGAAGAGATVKLMLNALFGIQLAAMGELLGVVQRAGLDLAKTLDVLASTPVLSPAAKVAAGAMLAGNFAPMFPIELVAKDFRYALATADVANADVPLTRATHAIYMDAGERGDGALNITGVARRYL
jgi:3-hydroxyisobutyrate dehydrogenase